MSWRLDGIDGHRNYDWVERLCAGGFLLGRPPWLQDRQRPMTPDSNVPHCEYCKKPGIAHASGPMPLCAEHLATHTLNRSTVVADPPEFGDFDKSG